MVDAFLVYFFTCFKSQKSNFLQKAVDSYNDALYNQTFTILWIINWYFIKYFKMY